MRDENEVGYDEADTVDEGEELDVLDEIETVEVVLDVDAVIDGVANKSVVSSTR